MFVDTSGLIWTVGPTRSKSATTADPSSTVPFPALGDVRPRRDRGAVRVQRQPLGHHLAGAEWAGRGQLVVQSTGSMPEDVSTFAVNDALKTYRADSR
jgi:hypothetical protein